MSTKFSRSPHRLRSFLGLGSDFRVTPTSHRSIRLDSLATQRNFHVSPLKATLRACLKRKSPSPTADRAQVIPRSLPLSHAPLPFFPHQSHLSHAQRVPRYSRVLLPFIISYLSSLRRQIRPVKSGQKFQNGALILFVCTLISAPFFVFNPRVRVS